MKILDGITQGSEAWLLERAKRHCASEAPVMMGASKRTKRNDLIRMRATGAEKEFSEWVKTNLLNKGHDVEARARALLEQNIGEELYQVTCVSDDGTMLASLDGLTMDERRAFEHKLWNQDLVAAIRADETVFPNGEEWQLEHTLLVTGAELVYFMCSDGTEDHCVMQEYRPVPGRAQQLLAGWKQFDEDVANYVHVEAAPPVVGKVVADLPALTVQITGGVQSSNLPAFKASALAFIQSINTTLETDQDFADAEKAMSACEQAEKRIALVKEQALAQTATIDDLFRAMEEIREGLRQKRLTLDKLVASRKDAIRAEIRKSGIDRLAAHIVMLNERLGATNRAYFDSVPCDFSGVMKGKKTISSLRDAVDTELARAKIAANEIADRIGLNLLQLRDHAKGHAFLFADEAQIVLKTPDDLKTLIRLRITEHQAAEQKRLDAERERIRQEEEAKARAAQPAVTTVSQPQPITGPGSTGRAPPTPKPVPEGIRPSAKAIAELVAKHYGVSEDRALAWLIATDFRKKAA